MSTTSLEGKPSFWLKVAEENLFDMCYEMGLTEEKFIKFQKKRFFKSVFISFPLILLAFFSDWWWSLVGLALGGFIWWHEYNRTKRIYKNFKFIKILQFSKFQRLLAPYLLSVDSTLYGVFTRMLERTEEEHIKSAIERLLIEMNEYPSSDVPFVKFAKNASGTDDSILFMTTLFDFQQNSSDKTIIMELVKLSSEQLFEGVDEIITFKIRKLTMFPTKLTMASFIVVLGYAITIIADSFTSGFLG
ncbi:hypothetical protein [Cytobacillus horneckiae]|uniref:hypothetical protein n=1 Tax=Cytobacillus horneckiae TaxID=549687 RepID=UPI003D24601F